MKKKQLTAFAVSLTLVWLFIPTWPARAQGLLPFGGFVITQVECTCSSGISWIFFAPLHLGGPVTIAGPMAYSPYSTDLYSYYEIGVPATWELGDYILVQSCWMTAGNSCVTLPSVGLMNKVGTSLSI